MRFTVTFIFLFILCVYAEDYSSLKPNNLNEAEWDRVVKGHMSLMNENKIIYFNGKVIDANDLAVSDAEVEVKIVKNNESLSERMSSRRKNQIKKIIKTITDTNGLFTIKEETGTSLRILSIKKGDLSLSGKAVDCFFKAKMIYSGNTHTLTIK